MWLIRLPYTLCLFDAGLPVSFILIWWKEATKKQIFRWSNQNESTWLERSLVATHETQSRGTDSQCSFWRFRAGTIAKWSNIHNNNNKVEALVESRSIAALTFLQVPWAIQSIFPRWAWQIDGAAFQFTSMNGPFVEENGLCRLMSSCRARFWIREKQFKFVRSWLSEVSSVFSCRWKLLSRQQPYNFRTKQPEKV